MNKFGIVREYDPASQTATIEFVRPDACAKCGACGRMNQRGTITLPCVAEVGDWVRITLPDRHFLQGTAIAYLIPLLLFLGGIALGYCTSGHNELWALVGGLGGLLIAMVCLWLANRAIAKKPDWNPAVDRVYTEKPEMDEIGCQK